MTSLVAQSLAVRLDRTSILSGIDVRFDHPHSVALTGRSGAGKTTLLHTLAGLRRPTAGRVLWDENDIYALGERARARLRLTHMGFVFQRSDLLSELTLAQNISLPLEMRGESSRTAARRSRDLIERLGLQGCAARRPDRVSGGQRQRAAVGRAIIGAPRVVFADEPTGALDTGNGESVMNLLLEVTRESRAMLLMVTHDQGLANRCDRVITLVDGRIDTDIMTDRGVAP